VCVCVCVCVCVRERERGRGRCVLFNDAVKYGDYVVSILDE
jgi:hypothetical protein